MTLSSRPIYAEDYGISDSSSFDNTDELTAAIIAARTSSRRLELPPGEFRVSGSLLCSGVDISGTQGGNGTRLIVTEPNVSLLSFTGRDHNGDFDTRGSVRDMLLMPDTGVAGFVAIDARGDVTYQPDHLRIERVRISGLGTGSWHIGVLINGLDRVSGAIGNRGLHMEEVLIFSITGNYIVLRGVNDANLIGVRCYAPLGAGTPMFFLGGSAAVYNENIYGFGCEAPVFYGEFTRDSHVVGRFATVTKNPASTPGLVVAP